MLSVTMAMAHVKEDMHPEQIFEVRKRIRLERSSSAVVEDFWEFLVGKLVSDQHPKDPCVFLLREPSSGWNELHGDVRRFHLEMLASGKVAWNPGSRR